MKESWKRWIVLALALVVLCVLPAHAAEAAPDASLLSVTRTRIDVTGVKSRHPYSNNEDRSWTVSCPGADRITLTFDAQTKLEYSFDFLYLFDSSGNQVGKYTGYDLQDRTVTVESDCVVLRLRSNSSGACWGFEVTEAHAEGNWDYQATVVQPAHGFLSVSPMAYNAGTTITVTPHEEEEWKIKTICVDGKPLEGSSFSASGNHVITAKLDIQYPDAKILGSGKCGTHLTWVLYENGELWISGTGSMSFYSAYDRQPWYNLRDQITSVILEPGVTSVGASAFEQCINMKQLTLPAGLENIFASAFLGCSSLTDVVLPAGMVSIRENAFQGCTSLNCVVISDGLSMIGTRAFQECSSLSSLVVPASVTSIGEYAFWHCEGLKTAGPMGSGCDYAFGWTDQIPDYAFQGCTGLTGVNLPSGLTSLGKGAFSSCSSLTAIDLPAGVTSIGDHAFEYCKGLTGIDLPNGVTSIENHTFFCCSGLTDFHFSRNLNRIGSYAFANCTGLSQILLPQTITGFGDNAFEYCTGLRSAHISASFVGHYAFSNCTGLERVQLTAAVQEIGHAAFSHCTSLTSVEMEEGLTSIGGSAFSSCTSLQSIVLPSSVTSLQEYAFSNCSNLSSIVLSPNLTSLGTAAFKNSSITGIVLPEGVTELRDHLFAGTNLTGLRIPSGVRSIGEYTFGWCNQLKWIEMPEHVTRISSYGFSYASLEKVLYSGTREQWNAIQIGSNNEPLYSAEIVFDAAARTLHFEANGGELKETEQIVYTGQPYGALPLPTRTSYQFLGWFTAPEGGTEILAQTVVQLDGEQTLYAHWNLRSCTVAFDPCGGSVSPGEKSGIYEAPYGSLPVPAYNGHDFLGWFTAAEGGDQVTAETMVMNGRNHTLYAHWQQRSYQMTFLPNGGSGTMERLLAENGSLIIPPCTFTSPVGKHFATWEIGGMRVPVGTRYSPRKDMEARAVWEEDRYVVQFDAGTGSGTMEALEAVYGEQIVLPPCTLLAPQGHHFLAWDLNGVRYQPGDKCTVVGDETIKALWEIDVHTVSIVWETEPEIRELESPHPYPGTETQNWELRIPDARTLTLTFDSRTEFDAPYDTFTIQNDRGETVGTYTGKELAGQTVEVSGEAAVFLLHTNEFLETWGFRVVRAHALCERTENHSFGDVWILPDFPGTLPEDKILCGWEINGTVYPVGTEWTVTEPVTARAVLERKFTAELQEDGSLAYTVAPGLAEGAGRIVAAFYGEDGKMLNVQLREIADLSAGCSGVLQLQTEHTGTYRVFLLGGEEQLPLQPRQGGVVKGK